MILKSLRCEAFYKNSFLMTGQNNQYVIFDS